MSRRFLTLSLTLVLFVGLTAVLTGQSGQNLDTRNGEWPHYTGDLTGSKSRLWIRSTPRTSTSSKWLGVSRPTVWAPAPKPSWKGRR